MSKTPSNKLFNLVHSLSGSEKRYFKLFSKYFSQGRDSKYMLLFEAIDAQKVFDDEQLREQLYQSKKLETRKFSELKSYLFDLILRALQNYKENNFYTLKITRLMNNVKVLFSRSLYLEAQEHLKKAKRLSIAAEDFSTQIQILEWEKKIPFVLNQVDFLDKNLQNLETESIEVRKKLSTLIDFRNLYFKIMILIRKNPLSRSQEENHDLENIINDPLVLKNDAHISHRSKCLKHRILGLYYYTKIDYQNFYLHSKNLIEIMESKPVILKEETGEYVNALSNYALSCGLLEKNLEVEEILPKLLNINAKTEDDKIKIHLKYYSLAFSLNTYTGDFATGKALMLEHFEKSKYFPKNHFQSGSLYHSYFYIYFGVGEYEKALEYLNLWLNLPRTSQRQDLQGIVQILNLIIHYEIGNTNLLDYIFRSAYRILKKRNRLFQFERLVLNFIRETKKVVDKRSLKEKFITLKSAFEKLEKSPSEKVIFQYFDFIAWLDSKIKGMPFSQAVKERHSDLKLFKN